MWQRLWRQGHQGGRNAAGILLLILVAFGYFSRIGRPRSRANMYCWPCCCSLGGEKERDLPSCGNLAGYKLGAMRCETRLSGTSTPSSVRMRDGKGGAGWIPPELGQRFSCTAKTFSRVVK